MPFIVIMYARNADRARELMAQHRGATVGVYKFPAKDEQFCGGSDCPRAGRVSGWGRDPGNGHTVHSCGRRNQQWRKHMRGALYDLFGRNRAANIPASFRDPDGVTSRP